MKAQNLVTKKDEKIASQKANYESRKEQERKRRFAILSGNIKTIQTSFHLKLGEHAYYQCSAQRMADKEYSQFYTSGKSKSPFIQGGILRGSSKINTETKQVRGTRSETIDSGSLLFTNKRVLFVGEKQVVDIAYEDVITIDFSSSSLVIKYPQMITGESYACDGKEVQLYYDGIQRKIGRDKSVVKLENVQVEPDFGEPQEKSSRWNKKATWIIFATIGIVILFIVIGNAGNSQPSPEKSTVPVKIQKVAKPKTQIPALTPIQEYISKIMNLQFDQIDAHKSDADNISSVGVSQVKSDIQSDIKTAQETLGTLQSFHVPQEMSDVQSSLLAGVNLSIQAGNQFLQGLTTNNISDITVAKNDYTQADADITQGEKLLFAYEVQQFGSFATLTFDFNGVTIKNNFDVPISDCTIYLEASEKHWSDPWDYEADEQATTDGYYINIPASKTLSVKWEHITDAGNQSFTYPPDKPYDVQFSCDIFNVSQQTSQTIQSQ